MLSHPRLRELLEHAQPAALTLLLFDRIGTQLAPEVLGKQRMEPFRGSERSPARPVEPDDGIPHRLVQHAGGTAEAPLLLFPDELAKQEASRALGEVGELSTGNWPLKEALRQSRCVSHFGTWHPRPNLIVSPALIIPHSAARKGV